MQEVSSACQGLRPRGTSRALAITHPSVLPSASQTASASRTTKLSRLNTWPTGAPVNASSLASRPAAHDSGPMWFALPFIVKDLHPLLLPVSRRTRETLCALRETLCPLAFSLAAATPP